MILAVDLGNYNIKTSEDVQFISTFEEFDRVDPSENKILKFEGKEYVMEKKGSFDNEFNKTQKNYIPNLLWAIHKSTGKEVESLKIVLGIPVENLGVMNNYKEELEGKEFKFNINEEERTILIEKVAVVGEGISSFYALADNERLNDTLIVDIGGRTINVVSFKDKRIENKLQINYGMINYYNDVRARHNSTGDNQKTEDIKNLIDKGNIKTDIKPCKNKIVKDMFNDIKSIVNRDYYKIWFTGGGSVDLKDVILEFEPKANFMEDALFTNVKGNKKIAITQWRD